MSLKSLAWIVVLCSILGSPVLAGDAPLGGFIPFVGIGLTDEFKDADLDLTGTFFLAQQEPAQVGAPLVGNDPNGIHDVALLDLGAAAHIFTQQTAGPSGFDIDGNGFDGTYTQVIGGATGLIELSINDPLAIFAAGLGERTHDGAYLSMNTAAFRGQSSVATLSAPSEWQLPNIVGLPMAAQHAIAIRNSDPQIFPLEGRTMRTPQVDFLELGTGVDENILRRTDLKLRPGTAFINGPLYVQNLDILSGEPFHENPFSPTVVENGGLFIEVDMARGSKSLEDKELLFDTGADLTVVSQVTAKKLGFDALLDTPDFEVEVEGSAGVQGGIPGFYLDELNIDTVGGSFTLHDVPIAVLDVTNPADPGNTVDGIVGMNLFAGRDLVIDANPSVGQGTLGPSLFISDPVTETHSWATTLPNADWDIASHWSASGVPGQLWTARVENVSGSDQQANVSTDSTVFRLEVAGTLGARMEVAINTSNTLTTLGETRIDEGGRVSLQDGSLDAQVVNIYGGELTGDGSVFVGSGPVNGVVRNLSGRLEPEGTLAITGDLSNLADGTIALDLASGGNDLLSVSRSAFLSGTLEVSLTGGFTPMLSQVFTILTYGSAVDLDFDLMMFPAGYQWALSDNPSTMSLELEVIGIGNIPGDFNHDGSVDATDLAIWEDGYGQPGGYTGADFLAWQRNVGASGLAASTSVPEPTAALLTAVCLAFGMTGLIRELLLGKVM